jgi:hypothetical protein
MGQHEQGGAELANPGASLSVPALAPTGPGLRQDFADPQKPLLKAAFVSNRFEAYLIIQKAHPRVALAGPPQRRETLVQSQHVAVKLRISPRSRNDLRL